MAFIETIKKIKKQLSCLMLSDAQKLRKRLRLIEQVKDREKRNQLIEAFSASFVAQLPSLLAKVEARQQSIGKIIYPESLPVSQKREVILEAIRDNQVVIIAGETGSGKTTQIPKMCLELGRGVRGFIGHTQPRRLAARAVAQRLADELATAKLIHLASNSNKKNADLNGFELQNAELLNEYVQPIQQIGQLGEKVGFKVRFSDQVSEKTLVKLMTDGILLAEIQQDRFLNQYDTLIIDEAHERSLNIDFILGYLSQLLPKRPDLKVIITSATIDPERFAKHFARSNNTSILAISNNRHQTEEHIDSAAQPQPAPIIEVSGRTYPVEVRYRPIIDPTNTIQSEQHHERDMIQAIIDAVDELSQEEPIGRQGDILVFLSGEREIRDVAEALEKQNFPNTEVLPLFARLSNSEQQRIFQSHSFRRVVLSTNVAETSLTVPGIKYVIDTGFARISRYSYRTKVQRLPIEPISQASANQRKGRCGRVSEGICIRLYSEEDFLSRPEFTDAEILRTNLASVILQMLSLGLGDISNFPFVEPPDSRQIQDGMRLLEELNAIQVNQQLNHKQLDKVIHNNKLHKQHTQLSNQSKQTVQTHRLSDIGKQLAQLPVDPRFARMILAAQQTNAVQELLIITAALSIQDPRERPQDKQQASDEMHRRFVDKSSDFLAYLNLWNYLKEQEKQLSNNQFRKLCRKEYLNFMRIREWQDVYTQLRQSIKTLGITINSIPADAVAIHRALLPGLLAHIGLKDIEKTEFQGTRNAKFSLFPNSALFKKPPKWVLVAELMETSRLWGRIAAGIEPEWIEPIAGHLLKHHYSEPHWSKKQGSVLAHEKVTLLGLPIVADRLVQYGKIDPETSRELFIRHALVEGEWFTQHAFFNENRKLLDEVEDLEHRSRRRDILVDDDTLFAFYDARIPEDIVSSKHFDRWWKAQQTTQPDFLNFEKQMLIRDDAKQVSQFDFPNNWRQSEFKLRLTYQFEPGNEADGVTLHIPVAILNQVKEEGFEWLVPGMREELLTTLLKSLPKSLRRNFVPVPNYVEALLARIDNFSEPLDASISRELRRMTGVTLPDDVFDLSELPDHLRFTFRILDEKQRVLAEAKSLTELKAKLQDKVQQTLSAAVDHSLERTQLTDWTFGDLPKIYEQRKRGYSLKAYPALVEQRNSVAIKLFDSALLQHIEMQKGLRRLLLLNIPSPIKYLHEKLPNKSKLGLYFNPFGKVMDLIDDCIACAVDKLIEREGGFCWNQQEFENLKEVVRAELNQEVVIIAEQVESVLSKLYELNKQLKVRIDIQNAFAFADIKAQLEKLVFRDFVAQHGWQKLTDILRYLTAIERRLEKIKIDPVKDRAQMLKVQAIQDQYQKWFNKLNIEDKQREEVKAILWMIEELRVSLFAQQLGTPYPISDKRIIQAIEAI